MTYTPHPLRIQRKRTKGWRMPAGAIYVGRPTMYGNPLRVGVHGEAGECAEKFRRLLNSFPSAAALEEWRAAGGNATWWVCLAGRVEWAMKKIRGRQLACFCPLDQPCHADVLCEIANGGAP